MLWERVNSRLRVLRSDSWFQLLSRAAVTRALPWVLCWCSGYPGVLLRKLENSHPGPGCK